MEINYNPTTAAGGQTQEDSLIGLRLTTSGVVVVDFLWLSEFYFHAHLLAFRPPFPMDFLRNPTESLFLPHNPITPNLLRSIGASISHFKNACGKLELRLKMPEGSQFPKTENGIVKWAVKFYHRRPRHFIVVFASRLTAEEEKRAEKLQRKRDMIKGFANHELKRWIKEFGQHHLMMAYVRYLALRFLVERAGDKIKTAKITDNLDMGEIAVPEEELAELKNEIPAVGIHWRTYWKFYSIPRIRLFHTGWWKDVQVAIVKSDCTGFHEANHGFPMERGQGESTLCGEIYKILHPLNAPYADAIEAKTVRIFTNLVEPPEEDPNPNPNPN